jgi:hypothetical protein
VSVVKREDVESWYSAVKERPLNALVLIMVALVMAFMLSTASGLGQLFAIRLQDEIPTETPVTVLDPGVDCAGTLFLECIRKHGRGE